MRTLNGARFLALACIASLASSPSAALSANQATSCVVSGDKVASPSKAYLGDTSNIRLTLEADCPDGSHVPADIVLAIDRSASMWSLLKLDSAKAAAYAFVGDLDLTTHRVGLVTFAESGDSALGLSHDENAIRGAIAGLKVLSSSGNSDTNLAAAFDTAYGMLATTGRTHALHTILLLTDGEATSPSPDPQRAAIVSANLAKVAGTRIFAIGLGSQAQVDHDLLRRLVREEGDYYYSPSAVELEGIFRQIARIAGSVAIKNLSVVDVLSSDVELEPGSAVPPASVTGKQLEWRAEDMLSDGLSWTYTVRPQRVGIYAVNARAVATYRGADGESKEFEFPRPVISVEAENRATPTPVARATGTPRATCLCSAIVNRVPPVVIAAALANPERYQGWQEPLDPGKPPSPANPPRECLTLRSNSSPFHPIFNSVLWRVGCP